MRWQEAWKRISAYWQTYKSLVDRYFRFGAKVLQLNLSQLLAANSMKAISIKLPEPLFHDLAERAKSSASSQSEVIRNALAAYLKSDGQASSASCAERASRWAGMAQSATDLSTNPEHMQGFGA